MSSAWTRFATCTIGLLAMYLLVVLLLGEMVAGVRIDLVHIAVATVVIVVAGRWVFERLSRSTTVSAPLLKNVVVACGATLVALLAGDILYTVARNAKPAYREDAASRRYGDAQMWCRRLFPPFYWPTEKNFRLFKPNVRIEGICQGDLFDPLLSSTFPALAAQVAEPRFILQSIDEHGFRETTPLEQARTFVLGDSFAFGYGVSQESTCVELLERLTARPIYNLGVTDSSPLQQLMLLRHLLSAGDDNVQISHLLWMIFEGNDLEDSYAAQRPAMARSEEVGHDLTRGTVFEDLAAIPWRLRSQSMIHALRSGHLGLKPSRPAGEARPNEYQGVLLRRPLYRSERFGYRFFEPRYIARANKPASYVAKHPNRPGLDRALDGMAALGRRHGFIITVVMVPAAPRLYAPYFEGLTVSERPHFIEHVERRSAELGFTVVDLYTSMRRHASEELLFWRDDGHWNVRGSQVAAQVIADRLMETPASDE